MSQDWIGLHPKTLNITNNMGMSFKPYPIDEFCDTHTHTHAHTQGLPLVFTN